MYPLQHPQFSEFFYEEELHNPIYHYNEFEDDYKDEGMSYKRRRKFANPNPNRRGGFLNPNRGSRFPNSIHDRGGGYSYPYEIKIPSFDGDLNIDSSLLWINGVDKLLDMACILMEVHVEFVASKLEGRGETWRNQLQNVRMYQGINCKTFVCTKGNHL